MPYTPEQSDDAKNAYDNSFRAAAHNSRDPTAHGDFAGGAENQEEKRMFRKFIAIILVILLAAFTGNAKAIGNSSLEREAQREAKVKEAIRSLGVGELARVKLKLKDGKKLKGYISESGEESFVVTSPETGATTTVAYPQVGQVKGHNLSTGAKIAIGVGILAAVVIVVAVVIAANWPVGFPNR